MNWSQQQLDFFKEIREGYGHITLEARAGTGKTTTIIEAGNHSPARSIVYCAFNTKNADDFNKKLRNPNAKGMTSHSLGNRLLCNVWGRIPVESKDQRGERARNLALKACGMAAPDYVIRLVAKTHTLAREIRPHARHRGDLEELMYRFDLEPEDGWAKQGYDARYVEQTALTAMHLAAQDRPAFIDFSDMIFLPVRNRWMVSMFDECYIDEAQDWTTAQLEIAQGVVKKNGRIILVGDPHQAIYAFRGADSDSMSRLTEVLGSKVMYLTKTYRCGHAIVAEAQRFVPDIEADVNNGPGAVRDGWESEMLDDVREGDFILSRANAPMVPIAMSLWKRGKRARIAGRNIGDGLKNLIKKLLKNGSSQNVDSLVERVENWRNQETLKWAAAKKLDRVEAAHDKADMLLELAEDAQSVSEVVQKIDALFTDDPNLGTITLSTVHRAKGLEADTVWVLAYTMRDRTQEEKNIQYVAITRARKQLVWVMKGAKPEWPNPNGCAPGVSHDMQEQPGEPPVDICVSCGWREE